MQNFNKYLFCYFTGNEPEEERICFALSEDGFHFRPLNEGKPVVIQETGTKCCRDPFILRDERGGYYIVATDMKSSLGWTSNHGIVSWHSDDLLHWSEETAVDFHCFPETADTDKVWAPEALYDKEKDAFFVYYAIRNVGTDPASAIWYSYTRDFKTYTPPKKLFAPASGLDAIDADIIKRDGTYYMYYKDEFHKTICMVYSDRLTGPYTEDQNNIVSCTDRNVEGNCIYRLGETETYLLIMDMYSDGKYFMQKTTDMFRFEPVDDFDLSFHPRHGSVLKITDEEYERLMHYYESESNTGERV